MTTTQEPQDNAVAKPVDKAQYLVVAVLVAVGAFLVYDALTLDAGFAKVDPVGPRFFPLAIVALVAAHPDPRGGPEPYRPPAEPAQADSVRIHIASS